MQSPVDTNDKQETPLYRVGYADNGQVLLTVGSEISGTSLLLTPSGVKRLIRLLEAAIIEDDENE